jgi:hypothetical protein
MAGAYACPCPRASVDSSSGVKLGQDEWSADGPLTDAGKALIEQRYRNLEASPHASVSWEEAKLRLKTPFKR